jgi:hypothetical protein
MRPLVPIKISRVIAGELGCLVQPYPADWEKYGKAAGSIRNSEMLTKGKPHGVLAFHNDLVNSKGTKNMVVQSLKAGIPVWTSEQKLVALEAFIEQVKKQVLLRKDPV